MVITQNIILNVNKPKPTIKFRIAPDILADGTSGQGSFKASYEEIVSIFGKPGNGDGDKVDVDWTIQFFDDSGNYVIATIYNWKNGPSYGGPPIKDITNWKIGGFGSYAVDFVKKALNKIDGYSN